MKASVILAAFLGGCASFTDAFSVKKAVGDWVEVGGLVDGYNGCASISYDCGSHNLTMSGGLPLVLFDDVPGDSESCSCIQTGTTLPKSLGVDYMMAGKPVKWAEVYVEAVMVGMHNMRLLVVGIAGGEFLVFVKPSAEMHDGKTYMVPAKRQQLIQNAVNKIIKPQVTLGFPERTCPGLARQNGQKCCHAGGKRRYLRAAAEEAVSGGASSFSLSQGA